ncbi:MAG: guanylate kinase [Acidimicrobiales bacterium]
MIFVLFGPGGAGKGTVAARLVAEVPGLWLSRSWTTRARRPAEPEGAYCFVDRASFEDHVESGGFFEWAEFLGNLYGTPVPDPPVGSDVLLEIDLKGAQQVRAKRPDASLVLLLPPTPEVQAQRLRARGDDEIHVAERLRAGAEEERLGREIADAVVINDDLVRATAEVTGIVVACRSHNPGGGARTAELPAVKNRISSITRRRMQGS